MFRLALARSRAPGALVTPSMRNLGARGLAEAADQQVRGLCKGIAAPPPPPPSPPIHARKSRRCAPDRSVWRRVDRARRLLWHAAQP